MPDLDIAILLADEGVPVRAIARATKTACAEVRLRLEEAKDAGRLIQLPQDDWPPGFPRDQRALELSRASTMDEHAVSFQVSQLFGLAPMEVKLFLLLIQNKFLLKSRTDMSGFTLGVHICKMRAKLRYYNIAIHTMWGCGYQLPADDRKRALDRIFNK